MYNINYILTSDGYFDIDNKINDKVKTYGLDKWESVNISLSSKDMVSIEFNNGVIINAPIHHQVYNDDLELINISDLKVNDKVHKFATPVVETSKKKDENSYTNGYFEAWKNKVINGGSPHKRTYEEIQILNDEIYIHIPTDKKILSSRIKVVGRYIRKQNVFIGILKPTYKDVPINGSIHDKIEWLAGLFDCSAYTYYKKYEARYIKLKVINREFGIRIVLMCNLLGLFPDLEKIVSSERRIKGAQPKVIKHFELTFRSDDVNSLMNDYKLKYSILDYDNTEFNVDSIADSSLTIKSITPVENQNSYDLSKHIDYTINGITLRS